MTENTALPDALAAQVNEAAKNAPGYVPAKPTFAFKGKQWVIPAKPTATMLYHIEYDHLMRAIESILSTESFAEFLALHLDIEELETFIVECNTAWGLNSGN